MNWKESGDENKERGLWQAAVAVATHRDFQVQHEIKLDDKYLFIFIHIFLSFFSLALSIQLPLQLCIGHARVNVEGNENNFLPNNKSCSNSSKLQTAMDIQCNGRNKFCRKKSQQHQQTTVTIIVREAAISNVFLKFC